MCLFLLMPSCGFVIADRIHLQCFDYDFPSRSIPLITAQKLIPFLLRFRLGSRPNHNQGYLCGRYLSFTTCKANSVIQQRIVLTFSNPSVESFTSSSLTELNTDTFSNFPSSLRQLMTRTSLESSKLQPMSAYEPSGIGYVWLATIFNVCGDLEASLRTISPCQGFSSFCISATPRKSAESIQ